MDIYLWIFIVYGYPLQNVLAWISLLGCKCGYPHLYGLLKTDIQKSWISMLISVDFWKSMHGYVMDSRTRVTLSLFVWRNCVNLTECSNITRYRIHSKNWHVSGRPWNVSVFYVLEISRKVQSEWITEVVKPTFKNDVEVRVETSFTSCSSILNFDSLATFVTKDIPIICQMTLISWLRMERSWCNCFWRRLYFLCRHCTCWCNALWVRPSHEPYCALKWGRSTFYERERQQSAR